MATAKEWLAGARPRTLPAAVVPVLVASAGAGAKGHFVYDRAALALVVSLAIQIATNYSNDYSDGKKGTDDVRVGPMRLVASGIAPARAVLVAAILSFSIAAVAGLVLALISSPYLLIVGAFALAAGWFYTGGKHPYGYIGLGEVFVFVFFGLTAVVGTYFVQVGKIGVFPVILSIPVGFLAVALLVINNLRDIATDETANKMTLAVRLGDGRTRTLYQSLVLAAFLLALVLDAFRPFAFVALLALPFAIRPIRLVRQGSTGRDLIGVLGLTGRLQIIFGACLALGLLL